MNKSLTGTDKFDMLFKVRYIEAGMSKWVAALRLTGVGFFIGACILLGIVAGIWIDNKLGTEPIFVITGLVAGIAIAVYGVYRMLLPLLNNKQDKESS